MSVLFVLALRLEVDMRLHWCFLLGTKYGPVFDVNIKTILPLDLHGLVII